MPAKGKPASPAQRAAAARNLAKGRKAREEMLAEDAPTAGDRWAMLLSGTLSVRDLSDKEINSCKIKGRGGAYSRRKMPSHIAQAFADERVRRAKEGIAKLLPTAIEEMQKILEDPDAKAADKKALIAMVLDRNLGKTPEVVRLESESPWDASMRSVVVERDLADLTGEGVDLDAEA